MYAAIFHLVSIFLTIQKIARLVTLELTSSVPLFPTNYIIFIGYQKEFMSKLILKRQSCIRESNSLNAK